MVEPLLIDSVLFYSSIKRPGKFEVGRSWPDEGKRMAI